MEPNFLEMAEFADNPEPRCPVVLVLDTSGSMNGMPIMELNEGLRAFGTALKADRLASLRVEATDELLVRAKGYGRSAIWSSRAHALLIVSPCPCSPAVVL